MEGHENNPTDFYDTGDGDFACRTCGEGIIWDGTSYIKSPYIVGDIIYVRETWCNVILDRNTNKEQKSVMYKADAGIEWVEPDDGFKIPWKPSIHMPKEYARLFLRVKDVRIERLNEISEEDAQKEGCEAKLVPPDGGSHPYYEGFRTLWESIYGNGSFDNRYVWVIEFERISKEEAHNG